MGTPVQLVLDDDGKLRVPGRADIPAIDPVGGGTGAYVSPVTAWAANTSYTAEELVLSPSGAFTSGVVSLVQAKATHTSGATFTKTNWTQLADILPGTPATLSNTAPNAPAPTAAAGTATTAMRSDAVIPSSGLYMGYGTGSDGTVVFDGTTTVAGFTRSGSTYVADRPTFFNDVTVNSGVTVQPAQFPMNVLGTLTNNGTISNNGGDASGATGGTVLNQLNGWLYIGGLGADGGTGAGTAGQQTRGSTNQNPSIQQEYGGSGGAGGTGSSGAGGAATTQSGTAILGNYAFAQMISSPFYAFTGTCPLQHNSPESLWGGSGGSAGGGDGTNSGGAGGGGGTPLLINARIVVNNGTISADGGKGATPASGNCGGGGGGGGGPVIVNTTSYTGSQPTSNGGAAGSGVGTGTAGSAGNAGNVFVNTWS